MSPSSCAHRESNLLLMSRLQPSNISTILRCAIFTCDKSVAAVFAFSHTLKWKDQQTRGHKSNSCLNTVGCCCFHGVWIISVAKLQPKNKWLAPVVFSGQFADIEHAMIHNPESKNPWNLNISDNNIWLYFLQEHHNYIIVPFWSLKLGILPRA